MKLQDKLNEMKQKSAASMPPEVRAIMQKATEDLAHSGIMDKVLKPGDKLPEFILEDEHGTPVNSADLLQNGPLVVTFYRGVW
ncbi:MAG: hypothetical protein D6B25_04175 [Desulfobulbaceae bacterium]|nr:MAG: hypothetical protein D6B25_04175 [Desulfobulbaceae bacterium]